MFQSIDINIMTILLIIKHGEFNLYYGDYGLV